MAIKEIDAHCDSCRATFSGGFKRSFLGFKKLSCPECSAKVTYPLTTGTRTAYWILSILILISVVSSWQKGEVAFPGGLFFLFVIALIIDMNLRHKISGLENRSAESSNIKKRENFVPNHRRNSQKESTASAGEQIIKELNALGIHIAAYGNKLKFSPASKITPELIERMKSNKDELLKLLHQGDDLED